MNEKQTEIYNILLTPIVADKTVKIIQKRDGVIVSPQAYYSSPDEDMCDFSIGFYEVLYNKNLLKDATLLDVRNKIKNENLAGDTMNSFKTIANMIFKQQKYIGNEPDESLVSFYKSHYHCLANFWVIPMKHGRKSPKTVDGVYNYDSPILYIHELMRAIADDEERRIETEKFKRIHFMPETDSPDTVRDAYIRKDGELLLKAAWRYIEERARLIVNNTELTDKLYDYFQEIKLLER